MPECKAIVGAPVGEFGLGQKAMGASLVARRVKNPPIRRETWVRSLGCEDPLEEGMATYSSILAWRNPMSRGAWQATVHGVAKSLTGLFATPWTVACQATVHGVAKSLTGLSDYTFTFRD